jgi:glycosyltransferase involved in cell wall biosynthesis
MGADTTKNINLPAVGIIVPNYNMADSVLNAIDSAVSQDYPNKYIMVVDDCSEDSSWDNIKGYVKDYESHMDDSQNEVFAGIKNNVHVNGVRLHKHSSQCYAKNIGIQSLSSIANIFGFLDADDIYLDGKVSKSVIEFIDNPSVIGAVYSDHIINIGGVEFEQYLRSFNIHNIYNTYYGHVSFFISSMILNKIGIFDTGLPMFENYDLLLRAAEQSILIHIPETLCKISIKNTGILQKPQHNPNAVLQHIINKANARQGGKTQ